MTIGKRFVINLISPKIILQGIVIMEFHNLLARYEVPEKLNKTRMNEIIYVCLQRHLLVHLLIRSQLLRIGSRWRHLQ